MHFKVLFKHVLFKWPNIFRFYLHYLFYIAFATITIYVDFKCFYNGYQLNS